MKTKSEVKKKLSEALQALDLKEQQVSVDIESGHRLVAVVTSPEFEGVDEAQRQSQVWQVVFDNLDEEEQVLVDFIFTNTPKEEIEIEKEERARNQPGQ